MLSILILIPTFVAVSFLLLPASLPIRQITSLTLFSLVAYSGWLLSQFDLQAIGAQFQEYHLWLEPIGLNYNLGADGISLPLVALTVFLAWIAVLCTPKQLQRPKLYYGLILLAIAGMVGALTAQNLLLFFLFYELELIPFFLLLSVWGGQRSQYAAMKFLLYTAVSGVLILLAFFGIVWLGGAESFDYTDVSVADLPLQARLILLTLIVVGFGIKVPLVPVHTWQPDAYVAASPPIAMLLGGVLAKLGTYGLIRFGLQLFPECWALVAPGLAAIGSLSVLYGSFSAIAQGDIKRMVAYSSIGHMGYVIVATAAGTELSILGAVGQMLAHGLILALLFNLVGVVEAKAGTRELSKLNGLLNPVRGLPLTSTLLVLAGMASAGIPGMVGFAAEFLVFQGSIEIFPIPTLICILSSGLTAVYFIILINRTCFGKLDNQLAYYSKVALIEQVPSFLILASLFFLGLQPQWLIRWTQTTTNALVANVKLTTTVEVAATAQTGLPSVATQAPALSQPVTNPMFTNPMFK